MYHTQSSPTCKLWEVRLTAKIITADGSLGRSWPEAHTELFKVDIAWQRCETMAPGRWATLSQISGCLGEGRSFGLQVLPSATDRTISLGATTVDVFPFRCLGGFRRLQAEVAKVPHSLADRGRDLG